MPAIVNSKVEALITVLKQPSTMKGILGMLGVISFKFGLKPLLSPEDFSSVIEGIATVYFCISIFLQKT